MTFHDREWDISTAKGIGTEDDIEYATSLLSAHAVVRCFDFFRSPGTIIRDGRGGGSKG